MQIHFLKFYNYKDILLILNLNISKFLIYIFTIYFINIDSLDKFSSQQLDVLEYIHSYEYIHADIKASNLLVGYQPGTENQVFLVDYGLACRYKIDGKHKEYKYDQRKAHDGTIEFTSRDAHIGGE